MEMGLVENQDFGMINDACLTELTPEYVYRKVVKKNCENLEQFFRLILSSDENGEGRCTVGIWFKPLKDEVAHSISKKYQLYKG